MLTVSSSTLSDTKYKSSGTYIWSVSTDSERKKRKQVMDEHQKRVIMDNMDWICENTGEEFQLSTWFYLNGYLTKSEYDFMNSRRSRFEKNYSLFNHVINKVNSFQVLLNYLRNTDNQMVANLLENKLKEKLSYKRKMVGSTLEKFLIPYLTFLCTETKNDDTIVKELLGKGFITMDDSIIISGSTGDMED
ncbi:unnamed protein product [Allacma fusca]|uniref:Uncharacterized protein n=1 Tax=Allacma fusca TaxID=39272 RepID=A0A8J2JA96_9HEXA|nr:unnamed protein product [Allacma fusca]